MQNIHGTVFGVAAQTNYSGNVEIKFPKCFSQSVSGPILFLARDAGARAEIYDQVRLGQNDSGGAIDLGRGWIAAGVGEIGNRESSVLIFVLRRHPPGSTLFPYTTLFRPGRPPAAD